MSIFHKNRKLCRKTKKSLKIDRGNWRFWVTPEKMAFEYQRFMFRNMDKLKISIELCWKALYNIALFPIWRWYHGLQTIIQARKPLKRSKNTNFIKSKIENMNPYAKISDQDDRDKSFEFRPILWLFRSKKIWSKI